MIWKEDKQISQIASFHQKTIAFLKVRFLIGIKELFKRIVQKNGKLIKSEIVGVSQ
jgi:hypothetical protein